jgi:hypothetical protein
MTNPYAPPIDAGAAPAEGHISDEQKKQIGARLKRLNSLSLGFAIFGLVFQVAASNFAGDEVQLRAIQFVGTLLFLVGVYFYVRMRGRNGWLTLIGLLSVLGFVFLYFLPKACVNCAARHAFNKKTCTRCGAPLGA